jgi:AraC family transcriptional regulator, mar-sox-rob regulon activator
MFDPAAMNVLLAPERWRLVFVAENEPRPAATRPRAAVRRPRGHAHSSADAMIVLEGAGRYGVDGRIYSVRPGTVVFLQPGQPHDAHYPRGTRSLWISLLSENVLCWLASRTLGKSPAAQSTPLLLSAQELGADPGACIQAIQRPGVPCAVARLRARALIELVVARMVERGFVPDEVDARSPSRDGMVRALMAHIRHTAGKGVSLDGLAHLSGYSKYHLHRLFKQHAGMTVHEYLDDCREEKNHELIAQGRSRKAIADALGFSSPQAYSRWRRNRMCVVTVKS